MKGNITEFWYSALLRGTASLHTARDQGNRTLSLYTVQVKGNNVLVYSTGYGEQRPCVQHRLRGTTSLYTTQAKETASLSTAQDSVLAQVKGNSVYIQQRYRGNSP